LPKENPNNDEKVLSLAGLVMVVLHHKVVQAPQRKEKTVFKKCTRITDFIEETASRERHFFVPSSFFLSKKPTGFQLILVETAGTPAKSSGVRNSRDANKSIDASNSRGQQQKR
jgi:hypothetical protein